MRSETSDRTSLILLGLYWVIASSSFVWRSLSSADIDYSEVLKIMECSAWIFLALVMMLRAVYLFRENSLSVLFFPVVIPALGLFKIINVMQSFYLRSAFCAIAVLGCITMFNFILYFENKEGFSSDGGSSSQALMHHRYVEYLRSFLWIAIFGVVAFLQWELQWAKAVVTPPTDFQFAVIGGLLQLSSVIGIGMCLIVYAFHVRLVEIESN